jgi:hypothetical protein
MQSLGHCIHKNMLIIYYSLFTMTKSKNCFALFNLSKVSRFRELPRNVISNFQNLQTFKNVKTRKTYFVIATSKKLQRFTNIKISKLQKSKIINSNNFKILHLSNSQSFKGSQFQKQIYRNPKLSKFKKRKFESSSNSKF